MPVVVLVLEIEIHAVLEGTGEGGEGDGANRGNTWLWDDRDGEHGVMGRYGCGCGDGDGHRRSVDAGEYALLTRVDGLVIASATSSCRCCMKRRGPEDLGAATFFRGRYRR
jgi:hypothetical protein